MLQLKKKKLVYRFFFLGISISLTVTAIAEPIVIKDFVVIEAPIYNPERDKTIELESLAESGNAQAQYELAQTYGTRSSTGFDWYQKAANQDHPKAQTIIGKMYANGDTVVRDDLKAIEWFKKAANQGEAEAQNWLAVFYNSGRSIRMNKTKAKEWHGKACDNGNQEGCNQYKKLNN